MKKIKKTLAVIVTICLMITVCPLGLFSITASSEQVIYWSYSGNFKYQTLLTGNGAEDVGALIAAAKTSLSGDILIPEEIDGIRVMGIAGSGFKNCSQITSITASENIKSIPSSCFDNCTNLSKIDMPGVVSIGDSAFFDCSSLSEIVFQNVISVGSNAFYGSAWFNKQSNGVVYFNKVAVDYKGDWQSKIIIKKGTISIAPFLLSGVRIPTITDLYLPESLTEIGAYAFQNSVTPIENIWYEGSAEDKEKIVFSSYGNEHFQTANWIYNNSCPFNYQGHEYIMNSGYTCYNCKHSKTPNEPIVESKTNNSVTLVENTGFEYSNDGTTWQTSNVFKNLLPDTIYTFYQRVKESDVAFESDISKGLLVAFKLPQTAPSAPSISSFTDSQVILDPVTDCEYSINGLNWQTSNIFSNLLPAQNYTFFQRYAETDTHEASDKSIGTTITTDKAKQTLIPNAPTVHSFTESSITLNMVEGCEYSKDGTIWQESNVFSGLSCGTEYTFYQRYKETATTYVGKSSAALVTRTDKGTQTAPSAPTLLSKTHNSVTLTAIIGYEYSRDGINWQTSNLFTGLTPETNYMFYQRKAENDRYYVSSSSGALTVKTLEQPQYIPGDIDGTEGVTDRDAVHLLYHTFLPSLYPVNQDCDFNGDNEVNDKDAIYLLYHTFLPDLYPID